MGSGAITMSLTGTVRVPESDAIGAPPLQAVFPSWRTGDVVEMTLCMNTTASGDDTEYGASFEYSTDGTHWVGLTDPSCSVFSGEGTPGLCVLTVSHQTASEFPSFHLRVSLVINVASVVIDQTIGQRCLIRVIARPSSMYAELPSGLILSPTS